LDQVIIRARTGNDQPLKAKVVLTNANGMSFSAGLTLSNKFQDISIPFASFKPDEGLLMPRPYPGFQPLKFKRTGAPDAFKLSDMERIEILIGEELKPDELNKQYSLEVEGIWIQ